MEILTLQRSLRCVKLSWGRALPIFSNTHIFSSVIQWLEFSKWAIMTSQFRESVHTEVRERRCQAKIGGQIFTLNAQTQTLKTSKKKKPNPTTSGSSETWPHVSWGARPHSSAQFRLTTWCYCRGWDRCTLVVIAHPFQSGLANMMRSENAIFKKKKMTGRLFCRDRGRTDGLIIEEEEERRGRRTIRFRKHFIKK